MALRTVISRSISRTTISSNIFKCIPTINKFSIHQQQYHLTVSSHVIPLVTYKTKANASQKPGFDKSKAKLVLNLNFQSPEDALPFYNLPIKTLIHIYKTTKNDEENGYCKNRLYYIASRIKVPPAVLSEKLAKRNFVYSLSFEWIERALDALLGVYLCYKTGHNYVLQTCLKTTTLDRNQRKLGNDFSYEMGVSGDRILRDLWVLKYHHETIHNRLQTVKNMGIENLYPWMVRCSESILKRFITISQETKNILGENKSTQIYLASRLNTSIEAVDDMCLRMPALKTIRVTKVKNFLDFLIKEGFEVDDIAKKPRVLSASQKTVKERIAKLRELGIQPINLNVLCRSKKGFKRYCDSLRSYPNENDKNR